MARAGWVEVPAGHVLVREGERSTDLFVIHVGRATVHSDGHLVAQLGPGDYCGELVPLDPAPPTTTVIAHAAATLLVVPRADVVALLEELPSVVRRTLGGLARRTQGFGDDHRREAPRVIMV
jgi:CRP-like cAMP-binding protein